MMLTIGRFKFVEADSEDLRMAIYRLRYKVYAEEFGFEKVDDHPEGLEIDEYEPYSIHFAALNENQEVVGTLRLVLNSEKGFPIEHAVKRINFIGKKPDAGRIAEVSRLAVSKDYRRKQEDGFYGVESCLVKSEGEVSPNNKPIPGKHEKRERPVIALGLYRLIYHASKRMGISHLYLITTKKLLCALRRYGFLFKQIGGPVDYHGFRIPYLGIVDEMEQELAKNKPEVLKLMLMGLENKYHPKFLSSHSDNPVIKRPTRLIAGICHPPASLKHLPA